MEELNIKDLLKYYKSKMLVIILILIITICIGLSYKVFLEKPKYESTTSLILAGFNVGDKTDSIDNNELMINQKLVSTYQEITKSEKVLSQVIDELKLDYSISELADHVSVASVTDTEIIKIKVYDEDPKLAYKIVTKTADVFSKEVVDIYNVSNVSVLDKARVANYKSNMNLVISSIIFTLIGLVVGFVFVTILYYFDTTVKTSEQLENKFGVPILGSIPIYNDKKKKKGGKK